MLVRIVARVAMANFGCSVLMYSMTITKTKIKSTINSPAPKQRAALLIFDLKNCLIDDDGCDGVDTGRGWG